MINYTHHEGVNLEVCLLVPKQLFICSQNHSIVFIYLFEKYPLRTYKSLFKIPQSKRQVYTLLQ